MVADENAIDAKSFGLACGPTPHANVLIPYFRSKPAGAATLSTDAP